jgi:hypothetical protein
MAIIAAHQSLINSWMVSLLEAFGSCMYTIVTKAVCQTNIDHRVQRTRIKRELDGRCENATSAVKPHSHLTMQWQDPATFHKVAAALNFPPTYVSALYHASGHAESSTFIKSGEENEYIGTSFFLIKNPLLTKLVIRFSCTEHRL